MVFLGGFPLLFSRRIAEASSYVAAYTDVCVWLSLTPLATTATANLNFIAEAKGRLNELKGRKECVTTYFCNRRCDLYV
mgnify:FL=1